MNAFTVAPKTSTDAIDGLDTLDDWEDAVIDLFKGIADGGIEEKTDTYSNLMGESPKSLSQFISENSFIFKS